MLVRLPWRLWLHLILMNSVGSDHCSLRASLIDLVEQVTLDLCFSNVMRYLGNTLPRLDVEDDTVLRGIDGGSTSPPGDRSDSSSSRGHPQCSNGILNKLVSTAGSWNTRERTAAILTLLKLRGGPPLHTRIHDTDTNPFWISVEHTRAS